MTTQRFQCLEKLKSEKFDLLVIGGGVTGAGIALDAASRGMKTALVEKRDFASGTSSKSTKLIHGGLRYLKQLEVQLVREVGQERAILHRLAPHLVKAEKMLLPIIEGGTFGKLATSLGLWVYDFVAGVKGSDRRRMLAKQQVMDEEPLLRSDDLLGGGLYAEYRTDDARLTIELIKTATRHDATCLNYLEIIDLIYENGKIQGAKCQEQLTGEEFTISSKFIVSAAGPWVDKLRSIDNSLKGKRLFLSKGVHIVVANERLPLKHSVYFDVPDGRMICAIPRHRATYIGTTDTPFEGDPNKVFADSDDVEYLLKGANLMFPGCKLSKEDVESTWAGLRPLIFEPGKSASEMSRKDEIFESESGLISIAGGKLTGYRKMAERIVNLVSQKAFETRGQKFEPCKTASVPLAVNPFRNAREVAEFQQKIARRVEQMKLPAFYTNYLVENYGEVAKTIMIKASALELPPEVALLKTELSYCFAKEMIVKPSDFYERRTGRLYFNMKSVEQNMEFVLDEFKSRFNWSEAQRENEKQELKSLIQNLLNF